MVQKEISELFTDNFNEARSGMEKKMTNIKDYTFLVFTIIILSLMACETNVESEVVIEESEVELVEDEEVNDDSDDYTWDDSSEVQIVLADNSTEIYGNGVSIVENVLIITSAGTYNISGSLSNGQIIVNTEDDDIVRLIFDGVDISNSSSAPIYILKADKAMIVLAESSSNKLSDGSTYSPLDLGEDEPNATIFSMSDLTIDGFGTLDIEGNYNDGIVCKDGLLISSGTIIIDAVDDGIRGKDYLVIYDGNLTINSGGVGLKSDNSDDATKGYITIENGEFNITSGGEAIDAVKDIEIQYGDFDITSGGKGINGTISTSISGGVFTISSSDDAIHSNGNVTINDGTFTISSGDDAIHADYDVEINDGDINITKSYEGIESTSGDITINGGEIHLVSSDDGLNIASGGDNGPSGNPSGNYYLNINDGYIVVNAGGDGVDANSSVVMSGGILIVSGSTASSNSALDYDGTFQMNGGFLVATGTSRMAEAPSSSSSQNSLLVNFSSTYSAGSIIHIENQNGEALLTLSPKKSYQSVAFSSPSLVTGSSFDIYLGGSSTGTEVDGIYGDGTYSSGTKYSSFTISSTVTTIN